LSGARGARRSSPRPAWPAWTSTSGDIVQCAARPRRAVTIYAILPDRPAARRSHRVANVANAYNSLLVHVRSRLECKAAAAGLRTPTPHMDKPPAWRVARQLRGAIERDLFANFDPPQTFALRADEILGNERQTVWRSGRALQAKPARAHTCVCKAAPSCCATPTPTMDRPPSQPASECEQKTWRNHGLVNLVSQSRLVTWGAATHSISTTAAGPKRCQPRWPPPSSGRPAQPASSRG
jgi:hypothetical protein